ncbi:MAG: hypothetical protein Q4G16_06280 [Cruoricaptor ignavus]|nr:hypothetical protein [Cruoricaptor ignavus]
MKFSFLGIPLAFIILACNQSENKIQKTIEKVDTLQQKNGEILTYEKPAKPLISMKRDQTIYTEDAENRIRKIAEYYVANSRQNLVNFHKEKPESQLGFSFEENDWEGVDYTQIGIFNKSRNNLSTLQWLFYEPKSETLYEFDLNTKTLQEFK